MTIPKGLQAFETPMGPQSFWGDKSFALFGLEPKIGGSNDSKYLMAPSVAVMPLHSELVPLHI